MTEILLNSETKHSQGTKSCFFSSEGTYNNDLFSSLFGIFSENSEDILSVENNFEISEETHYSINLLREHQEETSGIFSFFNENKFVHIRFCSTASNIVLKSSPIMC